MFGNSPSFLHISMLCVNTLQDGITAKPSAERVKGGIHQCVAWPSYFSTMQLKRKKWHTFLTFFLNTAIVCNMVTAFHDISVEEVEEELVDGGSFSRSYCWHTFCR